MYSTQAIAHLRPACTQGGEDPQGASARLRLLAWQMLLFGIKLGGAAFIKWGQWSATREDMFPKVRCACSGPVSLQPHAAQSPRLCRSLHASLALFARLLTLSSCVQDLCGVLAELHDHAPVHSWAASKVEIEAAFGKPVDELLERIDHEPLASGSIAQVGTYLTGNSTSAMNHNWRSVLV